MARPTTPATSVVVNVGAAARAADALADLREHVGEHEHQQQRLHDRADEEQQPVLAQHVQVAVEQGDEGTRVGDRRRSQLGQAAGRGRRRGRRWWW